MDGYLSNKPENFMDDPEKLYRLRRREAQAKRLEFAYPKAEAEGSSESPKESPPPSPRENQLPLLPMGDQLQPERKIWELSTSNIVNLPILNLAEIGRTFEIKTSTIRMVRHSPFTGKEDTNLHLQAFIQLCQTFQHGRGDSRSNEGKALSVLATWKGFAMVLLSTGGDGTKLGHLDESLHEGILLDG
jgi:hypothetical protein